MSALVSLTPRLAYAACESIAKKHPQRPEDICDAVLELCASPLGIVCLSPFWRTFLSEDWETLYKLCNNALDRVRIRSLRAKRHFPVNAGDLRARNELAGHMHAYVPGLIEGVAIQEREAADLRRPYIEHLEVENLKRDVLALYATLKPKERAAVELIVHNYCPAYPRSAKHYSDRDVHTALVARYGGRVLSRSRIAELRAELMRLANKWITIEAPEPAKPRPTQYTEDMTRLKGTETALPTEQRPKGYDSYKSAPAMGLGMWGSTDPAQIANQERYRAFDRVMRRTLRPATPEELKEIRAAKDDVDKRVGSDDVRSSRVRIVKGALDENRPRGTTLADWERRQRKRFDKLMTATLTRLPPLSSAANEPPEPRRASISAALGSTLLCNG